MYSYILYGWVFNDWQIDTGYALCKLDQFSLISLKNIERKTKNLLRGNNL